LYEEKVIALGLIGCGAVVHEIYSKALLGRSAYGVRFVCDTDPARAASAAAVFDAEVVSLDELTDKAEAIIIATPPSTHASLVRKCLRPDRTIVCEKPYMTTHKDAREVCEESRACGSHVFVNQFRRVYPQLELARELVLMGLIGDVTSFQASEGGRFVWQAVSKYTTRDPHGGVLWDTGSHTLDMAFFASGLDRSPDMVVQDVRVRRDKDEPSHDFRGNFQLSIDGRMVEGRLNLSRKQALPNLVVISGTNGQISFTTDLDDRVRVATATGSTVLNAGRSYRYVMECFDVQFRRILLEARAEPLSVENFVAQIKVIEALANA
jgi:predicted dehydrogenase